MRPLLLGAMAVTTLAGSLSPGRAWAQPAAASPAAPSPAAAATDDAVSRAKEHFFRGVSFYKSGSLDAALAEFEKAYEIRPDYRLLYNIGQVHAERHDDCAALKALTAYLAEGGAEIPPERKAAVEEALAAHRGRVASVVVTSDSDRGDVLVDGVVADTLPLKGPVNVNAGIREISLRLNGRTSLPRRLTLAGGDKVEVNLSLDRPLLPVALEPGAEPRSNESASVPRRAWAAFAAAGLFAGGAVTLGILAHRAKTDFDRDLNAYPGDRSRIDDDRRRLRWLAGFTDGAAAAAVLSLGIGCYWALSRGDETEASRPASVSAARTTGAHKASAQTNVVFAGNALAVVGQF